jgi:hypothetical protein
MLNKTYCSTTQMAHGKIIPSPTGLTSVSRIIPPTAYDPREQHTWLKQRQESGL